MLPTSLLISLPAAAMLITIGLVWLLSLRKKPEHYHEKSRKGQIIKMLHDKEKDLPKLLLSIGTFLALVELARLYFKIDGSTGFYIEMISLAVVGLMMFYKFKQIKKETKDLDIKD